ncbi:hypothetical protein HYT25_03595 [Candidatus Pacearchaeota archaeon]|nr:hypothetical protein [Candidatus Pacearchaeota archaeon]
MKTISNLAKNALLIGASSWALSGCVTYDFPSLFEIYEPNKMIEADFLGQSCYSIEIKDSSGKDTVMKFENARRIKYSASGLSISFTDSENNLRVFNGSPNNFIETRCPSTETSAED